MANIVLFSNQHVCHKLIKKIRGCHSPSYPRQIAFFGKSIMQTRCPVYNEPTHISRRWSVEISSSFKNKCITFQHYSFVILAQKFVHLKNNMISYQNTLIQRVRALKHKVISYPWRMNTCHYAQVQKNMQRINTSYRGCDEANIS